jgi:hypothetical protein
MSESIEPAAAIGYIEPVADVPDADLALFLDGDVTNLDPENIIDFNHFQNAYSYADFLDDMVLRDELMRDKERLERELAQAKKALEAQVSRAG